jgi:hypothetical protein
VREEDETSAAGADVRRIFLIRHGEKPPKKDGLGPDVYGVGNRHSLIPRGWHRAAALAMLFAPPEGPIRTDLATPTELIAPYYGSNPDKNLVERTHQTILPLARSLDLQIETAHPDDAKVKFEEGKEAAVGEWVAKARTGVTLICWEHKNLHVIANNIPTQPGTKIPQDWPPERFDVIFAFTYDPGSGKHDFIQLFEMVLDGDSSQPISVA